MQVQEDPPGQEDPLEEETLQHSCLKNPMDRGAWQATVHRVAKESDMTEQLSMHTQEYRNSRIGGISSFSLETVSS